MFKKIRVIISCFVSKGQYSLGLTTQRMSIYMAFSFMLAAGTFTYVYSETLTLINGATNDGSFENCASSLPNQGDWMDISSSGCSLWDGVPSGVVQNDSSVPDGSIMGVLGWDQSYLCQHLSETIRANATYTISAYGWSTLSTWQIAIKTGGGATVAISPEITSNNWQQQTIEYTAPASGWPVGEALCVELIRVNPQTTAQTWFDNVELFCTVESLKAWNPNPHDGADKVSLDVELGWSAGDTAISHDVYFGADFNDISSAIRPVADFDLSGLIDMADLAVLVQQWMQNPVGMEPSADLNPNNWVDLADFAVVAMEWMRGGVFKGNHTGTNYLPGILEAGIEYFWRIDEGDDSTIHKGDIWSFTTLVNIAEGKSSSADSNNDSAYLGNDGNPATLWAATDTNAGHWWKVDLEGLYDLCGTKVIWQLDGHVYQYKIETSQNGEDWIETVDKTGNTSTEQTQYDSFSATAVRYIRIIITGLEAGVRASLYEFEAYGTPVSGASTSWRQFRADRQLTGRSGLIGDLTSTPAILWQYYIGGRRTMLTAEFGGEASSLSLPTSDVPLPMSQHDFEVKWAVLKSYSYWGNNRPFFDLDDNGTLTKNVSSLNYTSDYKVGDFDTSSNTLEKVEWDIWTDVSLYKCQSNAWTQVWSSPWSGAGHANAGAVIVDDIDNDGQLETVGLSGNYLDVFNMVTGVKEAHVYYRNPGSFSERGYGWLGAYDIAGDSKKELIQLAHYEAHLDVYSWSGDTLYKVWGRVIEPGIFRKQTVTVPGVTPVEDIDGDGVREIVMSIYNYDYTNSQVGTGIWHVYIIEVMTGNLLYDLENQYLTGLRDIDGDGLPELFTTETNNKRVVKDTGKLRIYSWDDIGEDLYVRWQTGVDEDAAFETHEIRDFPLNANSSALPTRITILAEPVEVGGRPVFFTRQLTDEPNNIVEVTAWQADGLGAINSLGTLEGPGLEILTARIPDGGETDSLLLRCETPHSDADQVSYGGITPAVLQSGELLPPSGMAVIDKLRSGDPETVLVQGAGHTVHAFQPYAAGGIKTIWQKSNSRGTNKNVNVNWMGDVSVPVFDLIGDGTLSPVFVTRSESGAARLLAVDSNGDEIWHHDFNDTTWLEGNADEPAVAYWQAGNFTTHDYEDIVVQLCNLYHEDYRTYMISGADGSEIWNRIDGGIGSGGYERAFGGIWHNIIDWNDDGLDDVFNHHTDVLFTAKGTDGSKLYEFDSGNMFGGQWTPYAACLVGDFRDNNKVEVLYSSDLYGGHDVLLDPSTNQIIWDKTGAGGAEHLLPALGDVDGDGTVELLVSSGGSLYCYDPHTGDTEWVLSGLAGLSVTADIDNDGRDEYIVSKGYYGGNSLYAVEANQAGTTGQILWSKSLPAAIGAPAIAKLNGQMQIVVVCQNGYVYGLGRP